MSAAAPRRRSLAIGTGEQTDRARLRWRCRRGMRELDVLLLHFFDSSFDALTDPQKATFRMLLEFPDPDLQAYLVAGHACADAELEALLAQIRTTLHP